ncbi:hypothetical protein B0G57_10283 [Trinickia symbiotica]|uniref:Uncharacterized protein n=1 Tax=Trinickia symbiotica TaxID=863227 RepID=A0A2N7X9U5_9BURK|nr:hypothetical protein [Trinickia symbiotica]PMS38508.1 hypothetical protein C0Z20_01100 [Trinickia symbiotica]PPK46488.1 hypothetical protein B0G57_10283 [Trinickia symbiotica]
MADVKRLHYAGIAYLGALPSALTSCLTGSNASACTAVFDASYKDNGYTSIQQYDTDLSSSSVSLGTPSIVKIAADGSNAVIRVPYSIGSGTALSQYSFMTTVQAVSNPITLPGGTQVSWDIVGNQLKYDASVETRITRRMLYDNYPNGSNSSDVNFYDAG